MNTETPSEKRLPRYAVKPGCRGLMGGMLPFLILFDGEHWHPFNDTEPHVRKFDPATEMDSALNQSWRRGKQRIYRDMALTQLWVPPPEPIEVKIGMEVFMWGWNADRVTRSPEPDLPIRIGKHHEVFFTIGDGVGQTFHLATWKVTGFRTDPAHHNGPEVIDTSNGGVPLTMGINEFRCAATGRPLKLPAAPVAPEGAKP